MTLKKWTNSIDGYSYSIICDKCHTVHPDVFYNYSFAQQQIQAQGWLSKYVPALCDYKHLCPRCSGEVLGV